MGRVSPPARAGGDDRRWLHGKADSGRAARGTGLLKEGGEMNAGVDVWALQVGDRVVLASRPWDVGTVVAIQRQRNRVHVRWASGWQGWWSARKLERVA